jgi:hypothetical protein
MRKILQRLLVALSVCAVLAVGAFAGGKGKVKTMSVTFGSDVMVNGTLLKAGSYDLKFNEETSELSILKDGKVKAKTTAHFAPRSDKARSTSVRTIEKNNVAELIGFTFGGSNQDLLVGTSGGAVTGN